MFVKFVRICAVVIALAFIAQFNGQMASANSCPPGQRWQQVRGNANGQNVSSYYAFKTGRCVAYSRNTDGSRDNESGPSQDPTDRRFVNCLLDGVTRTELEGGFLNIDASRSVDCPDPEDPARSQSIDVSSLVRSLLVQLRLPDANPRFGPDPNNNEWKMLAVGFPVWLWTDGPRQKSTSASAYGITFRLSAELVSTTFTMGDGGTVTCSSMTKYSAGVTAGAPSPDCGYVYKTPSLPKGAYTVTATPVWRVTWSAAGFSGSLNTSYSDSSQIRIGELQALNR